MTQVKWPLLSQINGLPTHTAPNAVPKRVQVKMLSHTDVRRLLGDLSDEKVARILKPSPALTDVEAASIEMPRAAR